MAEQEAQMDERIDYWVNHIKKQFDEANDLGKDFSIDEFLKRDPVTKSLGDEGVKALRKQLISAGVKNLAGPAPVPSPDIVVAAAGGEGGEKASEKKKWLQFKEFRFGENWEGEPRVMEVKEERGEDGEEKEFFTDVYFPEDLDIESDEAKGLLEKMAGMREGVKKGIQVRLNQGKDGVVIKFKIGKEQFEEDVDVPSNVDVENRKDFGRWRNRKIREIRDRIFSESVFGVKPKEPVEPADKGKAAEKTAGKKTVEKEPAKKAEPVEQPMTAKGKEIATRIKALEGEEQEVELEEKEEEMKARVAEKRGKKGKEATEKAEKERKAKEEEARKKEEFAVRIEQAIAAGDKAKMDEAFGATEKTAGGVDREKLANAGVREFEKFILAGDGAKAKSVVQFFKGHRLFLFTDAARTMDDVRRQFEVERDALMAKKDEPRALAIEKAARDVGIELAPPKIMRQAEVERRVRELREKLRHGGVEARFGKEISPEKIKDIFGREAREGILGVMMANLIKEQEGLSVANKEEVAREDVVIDRMLAVFQNAFSDDFTREQCEEMYFAAKSWMLDRAAKEKPQGFFARLFRPTSKTGKVLKAGAYLATGVGSTLLTGPLGILITGTLRQIDVRGNRVLDEKMANKFRRENGGELRTNPSTGKLEQTGGNPAFMNELETNLANMLSVEARRAIDQDRPTEGMNVEERTQYYFEEVLARPEIANDQNLNEEERLGIAQRLAVQYAIDDETEIRRQAARAVPDSFWEKVGAQVAHYDPRAGRSTPASERFNTGMAATGIGIGLRLIGRTGWGQKLVAAYGGWQVGGALYDARYREQKDPMLNLEYRLQEADAQLKTLKQEAERGNWATRDTLEGQLREKLSEAKAVIGAFPQDIKFRVRLQEAERRLEELRMELILVEFCKEQDEHAYANETLIERKLATAQAIAGGTTAFDKPRAEAVAREKSALTWKGYGARIAGAAAGLLLAEGAHKAMEAWQEWREAQDAEAMREAAEGGKKIVPGAVGVTAAEGAGSAAAEAARTPEQMEADFMKTHGILRDQGFDVDYKDGKFAVTAEIGKGGDFRFLDQALRRITMQEYDFGAKTSYTSLDGGRVENSLANLRELIFGHKTGGMIPSEVKDYVHFDAKTGTLRIDDYERLTKYYDDRLFAHAHEITNIRSNSLASTDNTSRGHWQEMLDQKTGDSGRITAENFNRDPLVIAAEHREFVAQAHALGIENMATKNIIDEDTGMIGFVPGSEYGGFQVHVDHGTVQFIGVPVGTEDSFAEENFQPGDTIHIGSADAGVRLRESMDAWKNTHAAHEIPSEGASGESMEATFNRVIVSPLQSDIPKGWTLDKFTVSDPLEGDITISDPDGRAHTAKFDNGILQQVDNYQLTDKEKLRVNITSEHFNEDFFDFLKTPRKFDDLLRSQAAGGLVGDDKKVHIGEIEFSKGGFADLEDVNAGSFIEGAAAGGDMRGEAVEPIDPEGSLARAMGALNIDKNKTVGKVLVDHIVALKEWLSR